KGATMEGIVSPTELRRLVRNLHSKALFQKIREAERRTEAGERELAFYLLDLERRKLYRDAACTSFGNFIDLKTGLSRKKATTLLRVARALEYLPLMDGAFAKGALYWGAVRAMSAVATAQTEAEWIEFAKRHRVKEVERRVAASKAGEDPSERGWRGSTVRYPYE